MTPESVEAAAIIDEFPEQIRAWLLASVVRFGAIYRDGGLATNPRAPRQLRFWPREQNADVIEVAAFQRGREMRAKRLRDGA